MMAGLPFQTGKYRAELLKLFGESEEQHSNTSTEQQDNPVPLLSSDSSDSESANRSSGRRSKLGPLFSSQHEAS
jgi:hypothetical protein